MERDGKWTSIWTSRRPATAVGSRCSKVRRDAAAEDAEKARIVAESLMPGVKVADVRGSMGRRAGRSTIGGVARGRDDWRCAESTVGAFAPLVVEEARPGLAAGGDAVEVVVVDVVIRTAPDAVRHISHG